jgi:peptidyl-prolyl cis-trans isomerase C
MRPVARTVEQEDMSIRQILAHNKVEAGLKALLEKLRQERLAELNAELVDQIDITSSGELQPLKRPGTLPASRRPGAARPMPEKGHSGGR